MDNLDLTYEIRRRKIERSQYIVNNFLRNQPRYAKNIKKQTLTEDLSFEMPQILLILHQNLLKNHVLKQVFYRKTCYS